MSSLEEQISELRSKCIDCGRCTSVCPSNRYGGIDPPLIMQKGEGDISKCINCGCCSRICKKTDPMGVIKRMIYLQKGGDFGDAFEKTGFVMPLFNHPSREELRPVWDGGDVEIMTGCVVKCRVPYLEYATSVAVKSVGLTCKEIDRNGCCLLPAQFSDYSDEDRKRYKDAMMEGTGNVITLCAGCSGELTDYPNVSNIIRFLYSHRDRLPKSQHTFSVALEPGCEAIELRDEMAEIAETMGFKVIDNKMGCCGKGTSVSVPLMKEREEECADADAIVVACPMCFVKYDLQRNGKPVLYLTELVSVAAGDMSTLKYHRNPVTEIMKN